MRRHQDSFSAVVILDYILIHYAYKGLKPSKGFLNVHMLCINGEVLLPARLYNLLQH